jgi:Sulfotransferase family
MQIRNDPLVIGALGGSGTRVVVRIARRGGFFMGSALNSWEDSEPLGEYYDAWLSRNLKRAGGFSATEQRLAETALRQSVDRHLKDLVTAAPWGIKVPRTILMLPFWVKVMPNLKFLHLIRNGLDMAFSGPASYQVDTYGDLVLAPEEQGYAGPRKAMAYWQRVNQEAAHYGKRNLGSRYLAMRFEDLCADPEGSVEKIFDFIDAPDRTQKAAAIAEVSPPSTIGRWRSASPANLYQIMLTGRSGLEQFGYWNEADWCAVEEEARKPWWRRRFFRTIKSRRL